jgi:hypothetical protein
MDYYIFIHFSFEYWKLFDDAPNGQKYIGTSLYKTGAASLIERIHKRFHHRQQSSVLLSGKFTVWPALCIMINLRKPCTSVTFRPSMTFLRNLLPPSSRQKTSTLNVTVVGSSEMFVPVYKLQEVAT